MKSNTCDRAPQRSRLRWMAVVVALSAAVCLTPAPGHGQQPADQSEDFQTRGGKKKHRKRQPWPIKLGTSGSNARDTSVSGMFMYCCNGTLGALVEKEGIQYILSNNHVLGRSNRGKKGEPIIQPGYSDQSCPAENEAMDTVAHLTGRRRIRFGFEKFNKVDMALAEVVPGAVDPDGEILKIGIPGKTPAEAFVGLEVKKAGRTTGLTRGSVESVHNTVIIPTFPLDCDGDETKVARFTDQIFVRSINNKDFQRSGDSGSMVYQDVDECPAPVGLLFAGGGDLTAIHPASTVLKMAKKIKPRGPATFVGCETSAMDVTAARTPVLRPDRMREASEVKRDWEDHLFILPDIQSVGIGMTLSGPVEPAIYVYTIGSREEMLEQLPESLDGFRVEVIETEEFVVHCGQVGSS